jgi:superfamily II DNA or RNA helicase
MKEVVLRSDIRGQLTPRSYQVKACTDAIAKLNEHRSTLVVSPTGTGKTVTFAEIALRWPSDMGRVLVLAHRSELIDQACEKIEFHCGERPTVEQAQNRDRRGFDGWQSKVVVGSVQTLSKPDRLRTLNPREFGLVVCDEAHHGTAQTYLRIFDHMLRGNPDLRLLGVTATPERADGVGLGAPLKWGDGERRPLFDSVAFKYELAAAIRDGWLVDIEQQFVTVQGLNFAEIRTVAGDLHEGQLEAAMMGVADARTVEDQKKQEAVLHRTLAPTVELAAGRPTLGFCVTVKHAQAMARIAPNYGIKAECVHGGTPPDDRKRAINRFKAGECWLFGVGVFTEGFDAPNCAVVAMYRPTLSKGLYTQVLGRGTRPLPGIVDGPETPEERRAAIAASAKPRMTVLDFVGNSGKHTLVSSADILAGTSPPAVITAAKLAVQKASKGGPAKSMLEAIEEAKVKAEEKRKAEEDRRTKLKASVTYKARTVNPFAGETYTREQQETQVARGGASDKQVQFLMKHCRFSHEAALKATKKQASAIISKTIEDWNRKAS